jgi:hypothetical protein
LGHITIPANELKYISDPITIENILVEGEKLISYE